MHKRNIINRSLLGAALALAVAPGVVHAEPFSGEYLGAQAGAAILELDRTRFAGPSSETTTEPTASLIFGYRMPISERSPLVLGIEGELGAVSDKVNARFGVSGIGGLRIGDNALAYGRVGYVSMSNLDPNSDSDEALSLGGGVEFSLTERLNLRADYRYEDYGTVIAVIDNVLEVKAHQVSAGLLYTF